MGSGLIHREDTVLAVIDVQERLLPHVAEPAALAASIAKLVRFAGIVGVPIVLTEQEKLGATVPELRECLGDVAPLAKTEFGCFGCDGFRAALRELGRQTLVLAGIEAHICVAQTALGAPPDCRVHVVADAVSSRNPADKEIALARLSAAGVTVTSTEMIMYELLGCAGTDEFRAVLKLVKGE